MLMEFDKAFKIMTNILLVIIIIMFIYITPIALEQQELYKQCNEKILCQNNALNNKFCSKYNNTYNYTFNITLPID